MKPIDIKKLYISLGLNKTDFANKLGVTHVAIKHIEDRKTISKHMITTICAVFPRVSRQYLETGKGAMFITPPGEGASIVAEERLAYSRHGPEIDSLIGILVEIMKSDNKTVKEALKQNLVAFQYAVRAGKERDDLRVIINPSGCITTIKKG